MNETEVSAYNFKLQAFHYVYKRIYGTNNRIEPKFNKNCLRYVAFTATQF